MKLVSNSGEDREFLNQVRYMLGDEQDYSSSLSVQGGTEDARMWVEDEQDEAAYTVMALDVESKDEDYIKEVFKDLKGEVENKRGTLFINGSIENYKDLDKVFRAYQEVRDL